MTEANQPANAAGHAAHDPTWMAALATRDPDLSPTERIRAQTALESCGACADLFADLTALSAAIPSAAIPERPRDFTLTAADAERLRPRGLRRLLRAIGSARDGVTFPLALGLTTMGIAGLLLATVPALSGLGGATAGAAPEILSTVGNAVPAPAAASAAPAPASGAAASAASSAAPAASSVGGERTETYGGAPSSEATGGGEVFSGDDGDDRLEAQRQDAGDMAGDAFIRDDGTGFSTLAIVAAALLIAGLGLFALRWNARRLGDG